jgi:hypothetical protein
MTGMWLSKEDKQMKVFLFLLLLIALEALSFGLAALTVWVLSLCFDFVFSWKLALGLWILFLVAQSIFKPRNNG